MSRHNRNHSVAISMLQGYNQSLEIVFKDLSYTIDGPHEHKHVLQGVDGVFKPGRMTAIMGVNGAGKTTLLRLIAGLKAEGGTMRGEIRINGDLIEERKKMKEISGFVFQDDIIQKSMTVKEAIEMSAQLRMKNNISRRARRERVDDVLEFLHLQESADKMIAKTLEMGGGERKRTAIGMEMVVNPGMLFLDEPTTGLDTFTAYTVMLSLKRLAQQGRTIVSTIHQPSTETFKLFDDLLILSRGQVAYLGPVSEVVAYFAREGYSCPQYTNPADYIFMQVLREFETLNTRTTTLIQNFDLDPDYVDASIDLDLLSSQYGLPQERISTIQEMNNQRISKLLNAWNQSKERQEYIDDTQYLNRGVTVKEMGEMGSIWIQFIYLLKRRSRHLIRFPGGLLIRHGISIFMGIFIGLAYIDQSQYGFAVQIRNRSGALYFITTTLFLISESISIFTEDNQVFYREYDIGYYTVGPYLTSRLIVELPNHVIAAFVFILIPYYIIGFNPAFSSYLFIATFGFLSSLCGYAWGLFLNSIFNSPIYCVAFSPYVILPFLLISGVFVASLPQWVEWIRYLSPIYYTFSGMIQVEFDRTFPCPSNENNCEGSLGLRVLEFDETFSAGVNLVFTLIFFAVVWLSAFVILWCKCKRR